MSFDMKSKIEDLYEEWLLENYPDIIRNKEDLNDLFCSDYEKDLFVDEVKTNL